MKELILGDVVEHTNSRRRGCIVEIGHTHRDETTEYRVRPARDDHFNIQLTWWNSAHIRRVPWKDPFRRYLLLIAIEDDPTKQERRHHPPEGHPHWARRARMFGPWLPEAMWQKLYWRLCNLRGHDPSGAYVHYDLGREAWKKAAIECLERRDRAARWWYMGKTPCMTTHTNPGTS